MFHSTAIATSCNRAQSDLTGTRTQLNIDQHDACNDEGWQHSLGDVGDHAGLEGE